MQPDRLNNFKRILVIGDIHGCYVALEALLKAVNPGPDDLVITLGAILIEVQMPEKFSKD